MCSLNINGGELVRELSDMCEVPSSNSCGSWELCNIAASWCSAARVGSFYFEHVYD